MARYERLPIYKVGLDIALHFERVVAGFARRHEWTLGTATCRAGRPCTMAGCYWAGDLGEGSGAGSAAGLWQVWSSWLITRRSRSVPTAAHRLVVASRLAPATPGCADIHLLHQEVGDKGVAQAVRFDALVDASRDGGQLHGAVRLARVRVVIWDPARKQPTAVADLALGLAKPPPSAQSHSLTVDVADLVQDHFADAQDGAIG